MAFCESYERTPASTRPFIRLSEPDEELSSFFLFLFFRSFFPPFFIDSFRASTAHIVASRSRATKHFGICA